MTELIQFGINGVMSGSVYALVAIGFTLLWASMRVVSLSQPSILAAGAVAGAAAAGGGIVVAGLVAAAVGAVCGLLTYYVCIRPLVGRNLLEILIATLGLGYIIQEIVAKMAGPEQQLTPSLLPTGVFHFGDFFVRRGSVIVLGIAVVMIGFALVMSRWTKVGLAFRVTSWAPEIGRAYGINVDRVRIGSVIAASVYAGLAGLLVAILTGSYSPYMGLTVSLPALIAMLVGGPGNPLGAVVGGLLFGIIENASQVAISGPMSQVLEFGLLLAFMVLRPQGILKEGQVSLYWQQLLSLAAINAVAAWAVTLGIRSGQLSVASAAFAGLGAYLGGVLSRDHGFSTVETLFVCLVAGALVGAAFRLLLLRLEHLLFALATLALGVIATVIAETLAPGTLGGSVGLSNVKLELSPVLPGIVLLVALGVELLVLRGSAFDIRIRLSSEEPQLVSLSGKPPARAQILAFAFSTAVLALTGALWIHIYGNIAPSELGFERSFLLVVYAVVGGAYSGYGAMVAAIALTLAPQSSGFLLENQTLGLGLFLLVVILFRRGGILDRRPVPVLDRLTRRRRREGSGREPVVSE